MPVFNQQVLAGLANEYRTAFNDLKYVEDELNRRFVASQDAVHALVLSVASGEPLLLIGPPGTGKSRMIRAFCGLIGLYNEDNPKEKRDGYFEYLLTPFTEPGELFGFYDLSRLQSQGLVRDERGMMQQATVVYLDEVFNGSSAILNSTLTFINERFFHDRGERKDVALQCLFATTNQVPESPELRAIFDRFVLRCTVKNVGQGQQVESRLPEISRLLNAGWVETYGTHAKTRQLTGLLPSMAKFRSAVKQLTDNKQLQPVKTPSDEFYRGLTFFVNEARRYGLSQMSNRRLVKMLHIMLIHAIYRSVCETPVANRIPGSVTLGKAELQLVTRYFLDRYDEELAQLMEGQAFHDRT